MLYTRAVHFEPVKTSLEDRSANGVLDHPSISARTPFFSIPFFITEMDSTAVSFDADDAQSIGGDSGYSETFCSTESVRSSIYDYEVRHGRTYHAYHSDKYFVPNDEGEQERLDLHYHAMRLALDDKITFAPLDQHHGILDVGTGTGMVSSALKRNLPWLVSIGTLP